jgi:hypothetical protein
MVGCKAFLTVHAEEVFLNASMAKGALGNFLKCRTQTPLIPGIVAASGRQILRLAIRRQVNVFSGGVAFAGLIRTPV